MRLDHVVDSLAITGFLQLKDAPLSIEQLKRARLLRLSVLCNLKKQAKQIREQRKDLEVELQQIDALIAALAATIQFPAAPLADREETPAEIPAAKKRA